MGMNQHSMAETAIIALAVLCGVVVVAAVVLLVVVLVRRRKKKSPSPAPPAPPTPPDDPDDNPGDTAPETCKITFYGPEAWANDGWNVTADGSKLDHTKNIVAVPTDVWDKYKGRKVTLNGKTYTVKDSCTPCRKNGVDFDVLVESEKVANNIGIKYWPCSFKPT